jgi:protoporphyrinogen oxidase
VKPDLTIVGAGVTGLTAAIEAAERGCRVTVAEAHSRPGGRTRSLAAPFRANVGPHAIYVDGTWWAWLERRGLTPPIVAAPHYASLVKTGGRLGPWPAGLSEAIAAVRWHRSAMRTHCTGAIDLPGTTWQDRPAVSRGSTLTVATDQSAAPGLLAEVGVAAAQLALRQLGATPRSSPA